MGTHEDVDPLGRYTPVAGLTTVKVGTEALVHHPGTGQLHRLDPTASVIWDLLDGTAPLEQLVEDLAEAFAAPADVVLGDLHALIDQLLRDGLIVEAAARRVDRAAADGAPRNQPEVPARSDTAPRIVAVERSRCYNASAGLGWVATDAIQVGRLILGVRSDSASTRDAVRSALSPWLVNGYEVDANFSVRGAAESAPGVPWSPARLLRGCTFIGRHRDLAGAMDQLLAEIAWLSAHESGNGPMPPLVSVSAGAVVSRGEPRRAVLVPRGLASSWPVSRSRPYVAVASGAFLDPLAGVVLLPESSSSMAQPSATSSLGVGDAASFAEWSRVAVSGWLLPSGSEPHGDAGLADHFIAALALTQPPPGAVGDVMASVSGLLERGIHLARNPGGLVEAQRLVDRWLAPSGDSASGHS